MAPRVPCHAPSAGGKTKAEKCCPHVNQLFTANTTAINPNKMTNPPIHITPHNLTLSPALQQFIRRKMSALSRFTVTRSRPKLFSEASPDAPYLFSLSAQLALPGRDIQGNAVHENLYTAIDQLVAKLARLTRKRKTRLAKKFKRARPPPAVHSKGSIGQPTISSPPWRANVQQTLQYCAAEQECARTTRSGRKRGGGQEMRVFVFRRQLPGIVTIIPSERLNLSLSRAAGLNIKLKHDNPRLSTARRLCRRQVFTRATDYSLAGCAPVVLKHWTKKAEGSSPRSNRSLLKPVSSRAHPGGRHAIN